MKRENLTKMLSLLLCVLMIFSGMSGMAVSAEGANEIDLEATDEEMRNAVNNSRIKSYLPKINVTADNDLINLQVGVETSFTLTFKLQNGIFKDSYDNDDFKPENLPKGLDVKSIERKNKREFSVIISGTPVKATKNIIVLEFEEIDLKFDKEATPEGCIQINIEKGVPICTAPEVTATYGDKLKDVNIIKNGTGYGEWQWKDPEVSVGDVSNPPKTFQMIFIPTCSDDYQTVEKDVKVPVKPAELTIDGFKITKDYDGDTKVINWGELRFEGLKNGETAVVNKNGVTGTYVDKEPGYNKQIKYKGEFTIQENSGNANANNYKIIQPSELRGDIIQVAEISVSAEGLQDLEVGKQADGKIYYTLTNGRSYASTIKTDNFKVIGLPAGLEQGQVTRESDTVVSILITGTPSEACETQLTFAEIPAQNIIENNKNITPSGEVVLTVNRKELAWLNSGTVFDKVYNGNNTAEVKEYPTLSGVLDGQNVKVTGITAEFASKDAGMRAVNVTGEYNIEGEHAKNYILPSAKPTFKNATINPKPITIEGLTVEDKDYDGTTAATISGTAELIGKLDGDDLYLENNKGKATFESKDADQEIKVIFSEFSLDGSAKDNYELILPTDVTADITPVELTIVGSGITKVFDGDNIVKDYCDKLTFNGLIGEETANVDCSGIETALYNDANPGIGKDITFTGNFKMTGGNANPQNYTIKHPSNITGEIKEQESTTVSISFNAGEGSGSMTPLDVDKGSKYNLPSCGFSRSGYNFSGWKIDNEGDILPIGHEITVEKSITLYAQWTPIKPVTPPSTDTPTTPTATYYTLTFETNGGTGISSESIKENTEIDLSGYKTTRQGYIFDGWYRDSRLTTKVTSVKLTDNMTVYAKWVQSGALKQKAYIFGYKDGTVRPGANITRAEVAQILFNISGKNAGGSSKFSDVSRGAWYYDAVATLTKDGVISGYSDGTFKPNAKITRAEFTTLVALYKGLPIDSKVSFNDVSGSHWASGFIAGAKKAGYIYGYENGAFKPNQTISRAEAVAIVNNMLGITCNERSLANVKSNIKTFSDNTKADEWYYYNIITASNTYTYTVDNNGNRIWVSVD